MARRTKEDANETKQNILDAAIRVFMKKSVVSTTLEDIAREAGVTRGAIYWHFKDKNDILNEIIKETMMPICQVTNAITQNCNLKSLEELKTHIKNVFKEVFSSRKTRNIFCVLLTKLSYADELKDFFRQQQEENRSMGAIMEDFFKGLQDKGIIKKTFNHKIIAYGVYCYTIGLLTEYFKNPMEGDLEKEYSNYVDLFFSTF